MHFNKKSKTKWVGVPGQTPASYSLLHKLGCTWQSYLGVILACV